MAEWSLHRQPADLIADHKFSIFRDEEPIALVNAVSDEDALVFIVKAVNAHEALVKALEALADRAIMPDTKEVLEARALLAAVGGVSRD